MNINPLAHPICFTSPQRVTESGWLEHVPLGMLLIDLIRPAILVELGTHTGVSYCGFCQAVKALQLDTACYAIDTWRGDEHAGFYGSEVLVDLQTHHDPLYGGFSRLIASTFDDALDYFEERSIDLLHIDGCHSYEAVKHDFENWRPKLSERAVVLFHDTNVRERHFGVWKLWQELTAQFPHFEVKHSNGLGIVAVGATVPQPLQTLFSCSVNELQTAREFFFFLGRELTKQLQKDQSVQFLTSQIDGKERIVQELIAQIAVKDQEALNILAALAAREQGVAELTAQLATKERDFAELTGQFAEQQTRLERAERAILDLTKRLADAQHLLDAHDALQRDHARRDEEQAAAHDRSRATIAEQERLAVALQAQIQTWEAHWAQLQNTISWKAIQRAQSARRRLAPPDSLREHVWFAGFQGVRVWHREGATAVARKAYARLRAGERPALSLGPGTGGAGGMGVAIVGGAAAAIPLLRGGNASPPLDDPYETWIADHEPQLTELNSQREAARALPYRPRISVITPVYNPPLHALRATLESLLAQTYADWECCLADGGSDAPGVHDVLHAFAQKDERFTVVLLAANAGISANSNAAIAAAQGEFLAFLDHDDLLAPSALFEVAQALNRDPLADLLYSDHDIVAITGTKRSQPLFKPDWSPEIMLSANYLTHLTVLRTALVRQLGGFDAETDGAQDWDLFLRAVAQGGTVVHIPKVLYHWRDSVGSTAVNIWAKPYAPQRQLRTIERHLRREGVAEARAVFDTTGFIRVAWPCSESGRVSIIIPTHGASALIERCVDTLLRETAYPRYEIIVVNNGERRPEAFPAFARMATDERVRVLHYEGAFNYSAVNNFGARHATGNLLLFLNNDIAIISPYWLEELVRWAERPQIGAVGAKLLKPDGTIQHAGVVIGLNGFAGHPFAGAPEGYNSIFGQTEWYRDFVAVTGACLMLRREVFEQIGGFDEEFILNGSDVELCLRLRDRGYRNVYNPFARLEHMESATHRGTIPAQDFAVSFKHYRPVLAEGDPFYSPNLSPWHPLPTLRQRGEQAPLDFVANFVATVAPDTASGKG